MSIKLGEGGYVISEEEYEENAYYDDELEEDDIPEGCVACGGDFPFCANSCSLMDD